VSTSMEPIDELTRA